jgi:hypothetical protein
MAPVVETRISQRVRILSPTNQAAIPIVEYDGVKWIDRSIEFGTLFNFFGNNIAALDETAPIGGTTISSRYVPPWIDQGWYAVVGAYLPTAELRKVTARSGNEVSFTTALARQHVVDEFVIFTDDPRANVLWWGALGINTGDDYDSILEAGIQAAALVEGGARVFFPSGLYPISQTWNTMARLRANGYGASYQVPGSVIIAKAGFTGSYVVNLGAGGGGTDPQQTTMEDMAVDAANIVQACITWTNLNEGSGLQNVNMRSATAIGLLIDNTAGHTRNYFLKGITVNFPNSVGPEIGVDIIGGNSPQRGIEDLTVDASGAQIAIGVRLNNSFTTVIERAHVENCVDGIYLGPTTINRGTVIIGLSGHSSVTNLIHIGNQGHSGYVFIGLVPNSATNTVVDDINNKTATGTVALYAGSPLNFIYGETFRAPLDGWYNNNIIASQTNVQMDLAGHDGAVPPDAFNNQKLVPQGSTTRLILKGNAALAAGAITMTLYKNNNPTAFTVTINTTTDLGVADAAPGTYNHADGDRLSLRLTTNGTYSPNTIDWRGMIQVVQ